MAPGGKVSKDRSWKAAKSTVMNKVWLEAKVMVGFNEQGIIRSKSNGGF
jgi:hypothetical protein